MLIQRIGLALVGAPLLLILAYLGGWPFAAAVALLAGVAWYELSRMLAAHELRPITGIGMAGSLAFIVAAQLAGPGIWPALITAALVIASLAAAFLCPGGYSFNDVAATVFGALYTGYLFSFMLFLRQLGFPIIVLTLAVTWAGDTFAYFVGRAIGRHKLAPRISPKKSVEGLAGGMIGALATGIVGGPMAGLTPVIGAGLGLIGGIIGPLGDLSESAIKRWCGVKDSGRILPGHGGVLDRFDSLLFVAPCVYCLLSAIH
jgi:phosphatidate cytidylyltransferase